VNVHVNVAANGSWVAHTVAFAIGVEAIGDAQSKLLVVLDSRPTSFGSSWPLVEAGGACASAAGSVLEASKSYSVIIAAPHCLALYGALGISPIF
jgi:hypothetical protein